MFDENELYTLISAESSAQIFERKTGCGANLFDYAEEEQYIDRIKEIDENKFLDLVHQWAAELEDDFHELDDLKETDFDTEDDFWEQRNEIQSNIMDYIRQNCTKYLD